MIREIVIPDSDEYILRIPTSFIGKRIEVLAFEVEAPPLETSSEESVEALFDRFKGLTFDSKGTYVFDRNEATDYE